MSTTTPPATITPSISLVPVDSIATQYAVHGTSTKLQHVVQAKHVKIFYGASMSIATGPTVVFGLKAPAPLVFVSLDKFYKPTVTGTYDTPLSTGTFRYGIGSSDTRRVAAEISLDNGPDTPNVLTQIECTAEKIEFSETKDESKGVFEGVMKMKDTIVNGKKCVVSNDTCKKGLCL